MIKPGFDPGPLVDAIAVPDGERWTLVFTRDLRHPREAVWAALTEPSQLREWAPFVPDRSLDAPGAATLTMSDGDQSEDLAGTVRRADRPSLLEYTWGDDLLRWELVSTVGGTRLTLRHTVTERATVPQIAAGWHLCLVVAEHLLAGDPVGPIVGNEAMNYGWQELHDRYAQLLVRH